MKLLRAITGGTNGKEDRRAVFSWCLYDWANSAFVTSITVTLLQAYYLGLFEDAKSVSVHVLGGTWHTSGLSLWGYTTGISMLLVALAAPVLGAMADLSRAKKRFLAVCVYGGALFTAALAFVGPGAYLLCSGLYIVANFCWSAANIFYDGFLPELTRDPKRMDALSGAGFATGYLGGGLMLALNLVIIALHDSLGLSKGGAVRVCFLLVAGWWALFTVPLLLFVPEKGGGQTRTSILGFVRAGVGRLVRTLGKIRQLPNLARFLLAFFLYYSGIGTIMIVAVGYGKDELGLTNETLVACVLMIQFVGLPATLAYVYLARKVGTRNSIFIGLAFYVAVVVYAMMITTVTEFWILGFLVALVQGGTQAMSRSLYGSLIPQGMSAEFFGFFSIFNKVGPFLGPIVFAVVKDVTQSGTGESSSRGAILFLAIFFVLGFLVLLTVKPERGREEARAFVAPHEE